MTLLHRSSLALTALVLSLALAFPQTLHGISRPAEPSQEQQPATPQTPPSAPPAQAPAKTPAPDAAQPAPQRPRAKERVKGMKDITGTIVTQGREVKFQLFVQKAPTLCANFVHLARKGFWDGKEWTGFTRVIRQAGPSVTGYALPREFASDLTFNDPAGGNLCYAKISDKVSDAANATRFFITIKQQERWNLDFQIFGKITSGLDTIINLSEGTKIEKVTIDGDVDAFLKAFDVEIAQWDAALQALLDARQFPPGQLPGTPDRRTGEQIPNRPIEGAPGSTPK